MATDSIDQPWVARLAREGLHNVVPCFGAWTF